MLFKTKIESIDLRGDLKINGVGMPRAGKNPVVYIDISLLWGDHIHYVEGKVAIFTGAKNYKA